MRNRRSLMLHLFLLALLLGLPLAAQPPAGDKPAEKKEEEKDKKVPEERISTTRHTITLDGQKIPYTATAGNLVLKDDEGKAKASVFFVAYTRDGVKDPAERPVTFSFNGGPGAASLWVHLGAFGPKRVERTEEGMGLPPPGRLIDNEFSILDLTDLVFIDPVSTGYSRPAPGEDPKQFHGVRQDIESVAEFIRLWVTRNERWSSPKLVAGESYGTTRAAGLAHHLGERYGMMLNGVVLISSILNWQNQEFNVGNDMAYILILPTYTATAWYHKKLPPELSGDLRKTLDEAEAFALGDYASALMQGDRLTPGAPAGHRRPPRPLYRALPGLRRAHQPARRDLPLHQGAAPRPGEDGRPPGQPLHRDRTWTPRASTRSSIPARRLWMARTPPRSTTTCAASSGSRSDLIYERLSRKVWPWSWEGFENRYVNLAEHLRQAMTRNPDLKVLFTAGYYDLATPYFDSDFTGDHLGLPESLRGNVRITLLRGRAHDVHPQGGPCQAEEGFRGLYPGCGEVERKVLKGASARAP